MIILDNDGEIFIETPESLDSLSVKELIKIASKDKSEYGRFASYVLVVKTAGFDSTKPVYAIDIIDYYLKYFDTMPEQKILAYYAAMYDNN